MDLIEEFKKETGMNAVMEDGTYTEEYFKWLEEKIVSLSKKKDEDTLSISTEKFKRWINDLEEKELDLNHTIHVKEEMEDFLNNNNNIL